MPVNAANIKKRRHLSTDQPPVPRATRPTLDEIRNRKELDDGIESTWMERGDEFKFHESEDTLIHKSYESAYEARLIPSKVEALTGQFPYKNKFADHPAAVPKVNDLLANTWTTSSKLTEGELLQAIKEQAGLRCTRSRHGCRSGPDSLGSRWNSLHVWLEETLTLFGPKLGDYYWAARDIHLDISQARFASAEPHVNRAGKRRCLYPGVLKG